MEEPTRAHTIIRGRVQGVSFRAWTTEQANALAVKGWVRNRLDGSVEAVFEGGEQAVRQIIHAVNVGPRFALVDDVQVEFQPPTGEFQTFEIRR